MELYPIDIAIHLLNIIVLYVLLRLLVWKPVRKFMAGREERIQSQLDAAAKAQADAQASQTEYKQKLAAAQTTCEQLMAEGRKQAAVSGQKILAQAQEEAEEDGSPAQHGHGRALKLAAVGIVHYILAEGQTDQARMDPANRAESHHCGNEQQGQRIGFQNFSHVLQDWEMCHRCSIFAGDHLIMKTVISPCRRNNY